MRDLEKVCAQADIIVAAIGKAEMIDSKWLKDGAVVIDVGINRISFTKEDGSTSAVQLPITSKGYQTLADVQSLGYQTLSDVNSNINNRGYKNATQIDTIINNKG